MKGKWIWYFTTRGDDLVPHVEELQAPGDGGCQTRAGALSMLRHHLEAQHKEAQKQVDTTSRALSALLELESET